MEEQILEIIQNNASGSTDNITDGLLHNCAAKEIASHFKEFILWLSLNSCIATSYSLMYYLYSGVGEDKHLDFTTEHHIDEVYQLWFKTVKK